MNGKKFKKPLSVLLSVLMATSAMPLSAISVSAFEAECQTGDCSGTYSNGFCCDCDGYEAAIQTTDKYDVDDDGAMDTVYEIGNAGQLYWFADKVNNDWTNFAYSNAVLTSDITVNHDLLASLVSTSDTAILASTSDSASRLRHWSPIGKENWDYAGTFDGNNKKISGLYYESEDDNYVGFIGVLGENGTVKNLGIEDSFFRASTYIGAVVGYNYGNVIDCYNTGTVSGNGHYVAGVVGCSDGNVTDCYNTGTVSGNGNYVAGVVGYSYGNVTDCYNTGIVSGNGDNVAGVVGYSRNDITACYNTGTVSGNGYYVAGVVGCSDGNVTDCNNMGTVSGNGNYVAGVVGISVGDVTDCYNTGTVSGNNFFVAGVAGCSHNDVTDCNNIGTVSSNGDYVAGVVGISAGDVTACNNTGIIEGKGYIGGVVANVEGVTINNCSNIGKVFGETSGVGGIAGYVSGTTINNCYNKGDIIGADEAGGIAGCITNYSEIKLCYNDATINGNGCIAGIAGRCLFSNINNCYNNGDISGTRTTGGIVGNGQECEITICHNIGEAVNEENEFFPIIGGYHKQTVTNCYYLAESELDGLDGTTYMTEEQFKSGEVAYNLQSKVEEVNPIIAMIWGQKIGEDEYPVFGNDTVYLYTECDEKFYTNIPTDSVNHNYENRTDGICNICGKECKHSYTDGICDVCKMVCEHSYVDGVCGICTKVCQHNEYNDNGFCIECGKECNHNYTNSICDICKKKCEHRYVDEVCQICAKVCQLTEYDNGFCVNCDSYEPAKEVSYTNENGEEVTQYEIANAGQLYWFAHKVNYDNINFGSANAILTADITVNHDVLSASESTSDTASRLRHWSPIAEGGLYYTGTFDGNNKKISGLYYESEDDSNVGFIGSLGENGTVKNLGIEDSYFRAYYFTGALVGYSAGNITNCYNTGKVSGSGNIGGIVGHQEYGTLTNCYNTGTISGYSNVAGVAGYCDGGITSCYNTGTVTGERSIAGVVGCSYGDVILCYNKGLISGNYEIGGVAVFSDGDITSCYNTGKIIGYSYVGGIVACFQNATIKNCSNSGEISGYDEIIGGIAGYILSAAIIENCYNTAVISSNNNYVGGIAGYMEETSIINCGNSGNIKGVEFVGGISGNSSFDSEINNCYNKGDISGNIYIGGISGFCDYSKVKLCYNDGVISGDYLVGGVIGGGMDVIITDCYNINSVIGNQEDSGCIGGIAGFSAKIDNADANITCCYNTGEIFGNQVGDIMGTSDDPQFEEFDKCEIINSYYLSDIRTDANGKTQAQFESGEVAALLNGENAGTENAVWKQTIGTDPYPSFEGDDVNFDTTGYKLRGTLSLKLEETKLAGVYRSTIDLPAGTYKFVIDDVANNKAYGRASTYTDNIANCIFGNNWGYCTLETTGGRYTFTFNSKNNHLEVVCDNSNAENISTYKVRGSFGLALSKTDDADVVKGTAVLSAGVYRFVVTDDATGISYGRNESYINEVDNVLCGNNWGYVNFTVQTTGEYEFTYNTKTNKLTVLQK